MQKQKIFYSNFVQQQYCVSVMTSNCATVTRVSQVMYQVKQPSVSIETGCG